MTLKTAAFLAFLGTILAAVLRVWNLIFDALGVMRGLIPSVKIFPSMIEAFAALTVAIFFFVFQQKAGD